MVGGLYVFNKREDITTLTDDKVMAAPASQGGNDKWTKGKNTPAAIGIPITL